MDDATDIISAVANIVMEYQQEFNAAVPTMLQNEWSGVDADARARLAAKTREEVLALKEIFVRVQKNIEAVPGVDVTPDDLRSRVRVLTAERDRLRRQNAVLKEELERRTTTAGPPDL